MKNYIKTFVLAFALIAGIGFISGRAFAQVTITLWTFEGDVTTPETGSGTANLIGGTEATFAKGFSGGRGWNSTKYPDQGTGSGTAGVEFLVSTSGYSNISVTWHGRHSNTSANRLRVKYTLDGVEWEDFEADDSNATNEVEGVGKGFDNGRFIADAGDTWFTRGVDFSGIPEAANNAAFGIRIVSEFLDGSAYAPASPTGTYGSGGTLRYDDVTFLGSGSAPLIAATPSNLSGFTYVEGEGPSDPLTTILTAFNLTPASGMVTITPQASYEYSIGGGDFTGEPASFAYENGVFPGNGEVPVTIRLKAGLPAGSYAEVLAVTGGGAQPLQVSLSGSVSTANPPVISGYILTRFIEGATPSNQNRLPFAFRATLSNLLPSSTYRYYNKIISGTDGETYNGAGNCIFVNSATEEFTRTTSTSLTTPGQYGEFTTDANGSYSGWFITEPTGNARFKPGNEIFMRIMLNDGAGGTTEATRLTISEGVKILGFYTHAADSTGTAVRGISTSSPKNFVFIYDNAGGNGRPLYGTHVETSGINFIAGTYAAFYAEDVAGTDGAWGGIIPNNNAAGVRLIEERSIATGNVIASYTSENGDWHGVNTVNPTGGIDNVLVINTTLGIDNKPAEAFGKIFSYGNLISVSLRQPVTGVMEIISLQGKVAIRKSFSGSDFNVTTELPAGIYIVRIVSDRGQITGKVMLK